jgi:hypothetical protein
VVLCPAEKPFSFVPHNYKPTPVIHAFLISADNLFRESFFGEIQ